MLGSDEARAWYGPDHVELAASRGAIGTLLISDELFRQVVCDLMCIYTYKCVFAGQMTLYNASDL